MAEQRVQVDSGQEAEPKEISGWMLLCFILGIGLCFSGLLFVLTGIGGLIGLVMIGLGGLIGIGGSMITVISESVQARRKKS